MTKILATLVLIILTQVTPAVANSLVVRCSAETHWWGETINIQIDIVLPEKADKIVAIGDNKGKDFVFPDIMTPVGLGSVEIIEKFGNTKQSHRHIFIVTRLPDESNSLIGFYLVNSYVNTIRADLWKNPKTFIYFDTYNNEVLHGKCQ